MRWRRSMLRLVTALALVIGITVGQAAAQSFPIPSTWTNQRGSQLVVWSGGGGSFSGQYINNAAGFSCQGPFDMSGVSSGSVVTFVVTWKSKTQNCNSVTVWRGTVAGTVLKTQWQLGFADAPSGTIKISKGADTFSRTN